jgi:hypothetical protein
MIMMNSNTNLMDLVDTRRNSNLMSSYSTMSMNENDQAILKTIIESNNDNVGNDIRTIAPINTNITTMNAPTTNVSVNNHIFNGNINNVNNISLINYNNNNNNNNNINKTTSNNGTESSEVLEARLRRKSQNLKDLVANFWVPPNNGNSTNTNTTTSCTTRTNSFNKTKSNESIEALKKQLRKKNSEEALFGMFHPVDIDNKNCTTTQQNSKWLNALEGRKSSMATGPLQLFQSSIEILAIEKQLFQSSSINNINNNNNNNSINNYNTIIPPSTSISATVYGAAASTSTTISCDNGGGCGGGGSGSGNNHNMLPPPHTPIPTFSTCSNNHFSTSSVVDQPSPYDIVCGRNSGAYNYIGNRRFRVTVEMHLQRYIDSPTREDKTNVIKSIVWMLHEDIGARFLKKTLIKKNDKTGRPKGPRYEVMNEKQAREKVGHALRDLVIQARKDNLSEQLQQRLELEQQQQQMQQQQMQE